MSNLLMPIRQIARIRTTLMIAAFITLSSCANYTIPLSSFREQFAGMDTSNFRKVTVVGPTGWSYNYRTFPNTMIHCLTKSGAPATLAVSPSIEMRITRLNGKRTVFYFDRIFVSRDSIYGTTSRILGLTKAIALNDVRKIEVQDGGKNYHYAARAK